MYDTLLFIVGFRVGQHSDVLLNGRSSTPPSRLSVNYENFEILVSDICGNFMTSLSPRREKYPEDLNADKH